MTIIVNHSDFTIDEKPTHLQLKGIKEFNASVASSLEFRFESLQDIAYLNFDFAGLKQPLESDIVLNSFQLALNSFLDEAQDQLPKGIILFKESAAIFESFSWTTTQREYFSEWLSDYDFPFKSLEECFCSDFGQLLIKIYILQVYIELVVKLSTSLPDDVLPLFVFDLVDELSLTEQIVLLNASRFYHLAVALKGNQVPLSPLFYQKGLARGGSIDSEDPLLPEASLGILIPEDTELDESFMSNLKNVITNVDLTNVRIIPESLLIESWDGIDQLIIFSDHLSPLGRRRLQGFMVTEGLIINASKSQFDLENSISFSEYLSQQ